MSEDPLSDVLKLAAISPVVSGGMSAAGSWAIRFPAPEKVKFFAVVKGHCWHGRVDHPERRRIGTGDVIVYSRREPFVLYGDLAATPVDAKTVFGHPKPPFVMLGKGEPDFSMLGGHLGAEADFAGQVADLIPPWLHVKGSTPEAAGLRWLLEQIAAEGSSTLPGSTIAVAQLSHLMFIQVLRLHLATRESPTPGFFRALADPKIAPALRVMHQRPDYPWQLTELAKAAGMSRTAFAVRFKEVAGKSPLAYLTEWRMQLAQKMLRDGDVSVGTLADSLGYASESALSNAFKRVTGVAPKRYRSRAQREQLQAVA